MRPTRSYIPHRDASNKTTRTTSSTQNYHISFQPRLLPASTSTKDGGLIGALRRTGVLSFLDLIPAGIDCLWTGSAENSNPGTRSGRHVSARGMQPVPGTAASVLQCETLSLLGQRQLRVLLDVVGLCRRFNYDRDGAVTEAESDKCRDTRQLLLQAISSYLKLPAPFVGDQSERDCKGFATHEANNGKLSSHDTFLSFIDKVRIETSRCLERD